ncbi:hypothetical protein BJ993_000924 [Nocardioides aromaticivorans]|uniref:Uncharacterized protein n=1 Tax=Nocardioides aromaticivorans TaxID=200618 RepID=A0A7Z0CK72_9ACTN|nr:hypothetical protein [Nocardioides aromaticivorans]NYI43844.1 hypothetical protein [Nocardioides aromaticivorans]
MNFPTEFRTDLMARPADAEALEGLKLVEEKINDVITAINRELDQFDPAIFQKDGEIKPQSFGDTDRAPLLALHHRRAHQVTAETLSGVREDLIAFRQACRDARGFVEQADQDAAAEITLTHKAVERLNEGSATSHGESANQQAQQAGVGSEPTSDDGTGTPSGSTPTTADTTGTDGETS